MLILPFDRSGNGLVFTRCRGFGIPWHHRCGIDLHPEPTERSRQLRATAPEEGPNVAWWVRLKGVRDIVAGLVVLSMMAFGGHREVGLVVLIESLIALGDMSVILVARGSTRTALSVHGVTAALMILAAIPLIAGWV